jgi:hypothetical protein
MTPAEMQTKLRQWAERYPPRTLRELGWGLLDIASAASRAEIQLQQAIDAPDKAREVAEAERAFERLKECLTRYNGDAHQLRTGRWPD